MTNNAFDEPLKQWAASQIGQSVENISNVELRVNDKWCSDGCCTVETNVAVIVTKDRKELEIELKDGFVGLLCTVTAFDRTNVESNFKDRLLDPEYAEKFHSAKARATKSFQTEIALAKEDRDKAIQRANKAEDYVKRLTRRIAETRLTSGRAFDSLIELERELGGK